MLLLREVDKQHRLTQRLATVLEDARNPVLVRHKLETMIRQAVVKAHELLWHHFIEQHDESPKEIVLDFDGTDIPVHGDQPAQSARLAGDL